MSGWAPVPTDLNDDARVRVCSPVEQLTLVRLYLTARGRNHVPMAPLRTGESAPAVWRSIWGSEMALAIGRLVEAGLVLVEPTGLRLVITTNLRGVPSGGEGGPVSGGESFYSTGATDGGTTAQREALAARTRKLRFVFKNRTGELAEVDPSLSWESWLESDHGRAVYARRVLGHGETGRSRGPSGTFQRTTGTPAERSSGTHHGNVPVVPAERHGNATGTLAPLSSETSSSEEKERERDARDTHHGNASGTARNGTGTPAERNATGTVQRNALDDLREAAGSNATLIGAPTFERELLAMLTRLNLTLDELRAVGSALAKPSDWWPPGKTAAPKHCNLKHLAGYHDKSGAYEWGPLLALVSHVRGHAATKTRTKPAAPPPIPSRDVDPEFAARFRAEIAAQFPATPKDAAHG